MKTEIKINNSNLRIQQIMFSNGDNSITLTDKKSMRLQSVIFTEPTDATVPAWMTLSTIGITTATLPTNIKDHYNKAWILVKGKEKYSGQKYNDIERGIIMAFFAQFTTTDHLQPAELLCHCLKDREMTTLFYKSYGRKAMQDLRNNVMECISGAYSPKPEAHSMPLTYQRSRRYNIYQLAQDLVDAEVEIYTDPELIGKYKPISRGSSDGSKFVSDRWMKIHSITCNRTRANLSLNYLAKVLVEIPENTVGVAEGPMELETYKSFSLVRDGLLNMSKIGVRFTKKSGKLIGKLKSLHIIECSLLGENDYLLNLTTTPIVARTNVCHFTSLELAKAERNVILSKVQLEYFQYKKMWKSYEEKKAAGLEVEEPTRETAPEDIIEKTDQELFLESLGIYGNHYYPKYTTVTDVKDTYVATEIIGKVQGVSEDSSIRRKNYYDFYKTGKCKNKAIEAIISTIDFSIPEKTFEMYNKVAIKTLRDKKFRFIMSKKLVFVEDSDKPSVEGKIVTLPVFDGAPVNVSVKWKVVNSNINV